ncbi:MAG TPA: ABC transporter permease [Myxococcota bacterium]|nr:ABC transporter permease [Myxococcota bacterium]
MSRWAASLGRIGAVARKELVHLRRDRLTGGMVLGVPLMMTLLFGYAINQDVRHLRAGVADLSGSQAARFLVADAQATQVIDVVRQARSVDELAHALVAGDISVGIAIPPDFDRRRLGGERPAAQLLVDGGDPIVLGAARTLADLPPDRRFAPVAQHGAVSAPVFELRAYYNPERRSAVHIVPALCGVILTLTLVLFTAVAIVRERERGNLELLITTPVQTPELMIGKIAPYVAIGYGQMTLILLLGRFLFDVPIAGGLGTLYLAAGAFVAAALTLGLLISTLAQTQFQAFQMAFVTFLPQILLSGFMFPYDGMPAPARALAQVLPLTHFLRVVRGIVLRGASLGDVSGEVKALLIFFSLAFALAVLRFRKRLD